MAIYSFSVFTQMRFRESHEITCAHVLVQYVRVQDNNGQSNEHRNWDDCRSKVGRVRFCIVPECPCDWGDLAGLVAIWV